MAATNPRPDGIAPGAPLRSDVGVLVVVVLLLLAVVLAAFALWFQWRQTRRCLGFHGADGAWAVQTAPRVELWRLGWDESRRRTVAVDRLDVSRARGLEHLRRGLVEDANFDWEGEGGGPGREGSWDEAVAFFESGADAPATVIAFDLDPPAALTVVGRPGRVKLGRIAEGVKLWIRSTRESMPP